MDLVFRNKTVEEMLAWLENKGYNEWIRESFEGLVCYCLLHVSKVVCIYVSPI